MNKKKNISRRKFIKKIGISAGSMIVAQTMLNNISMAEQAKTSDISHIYLSKDHGPGQNMENIIRMMGGIQSLIGPDDIVIIKTNAQWWNQGSPNLAAIKRFIELILNMPGFKGEIIVVDNNHRGRYPWNYGAWSETFEINSDVPDVYNLIDLIKLFHNQGFPNVTYYCWIDVKSGIQRVFGPEDGDGYVYRTDMVYNNDAIGEDYRETIMTYPIFTSSCSGSIIDFKNGVWENGDYINKPLKFFNFAGLCAHSRYAGVTSSIKNYFGIVDLSGSANDKMFQDYYNFHSFAFNGNTIGPVSGMLGGAVGTFLLNIRAADLNITTAEWVGWEHRTNIDKAEHTGTILASADPVALDYYSSKYVLYPAGTANESALGEYLNPDQQKLPFRQDLEKCNALGIGTLDEGQMEIHTITPLHSTLISFNAKFMKKNNVELIWTIEHAPNLYGFEIQRSQADLNFHKIYFKQFSVTSPKVYRFLDENLAYEIYYYRLKLIYSNGKYEYSEIKMVDVGNSKTISLFQNYPNPFNQETVIQFGVPKSSMVTLCISDINNREVVRLLNEKKNPGIYSIKWNGKDKFNRDVSSGAYVCRTNIEGFTQSIKMLLIK